MLKKVILLVMITLFVEQISAQQQNLPLNREFNLVNQKVFNSHYSNTHTSFQPIIQSQINLGESRTLGLSLGEDNSYLVNIKKEEKRNRSWVIRKMFFENLLIVDTGKLYLTIDPLLNLEMGKDSEDSTGQTLSKNTRGIIVRGNVGKKFSFETSFYENQATLPGYLSDYADATGVVPGQGRWKRFKTNGYDFASSSANISYSPAKFINFQMGIGKHFIGDGYRSLLLSDVSFNYPFWKITTTFGKKNQFQYTKLNASLSSLTRRDEGSTAEALFVRKSMSTHYFSWLASKWLNIGLFESTLWQTEDSSGTKPFQYQQLNPIIGVNALTTITDNANHSNVGVNTKIKLPFKLVLYNQFVYDCNQYEKTSGYQVGMKYFGINNLTLQTEYNVMNNPYNTTFEPELEKFTNYNEFLAHPSGDNFKEIVGIINYKFKRLFTQIKINQIKFNAQGISFPIFAPVNRKIMNIQAHVGFLVNPKNNMSIVLGIHQRKEEVDVPVGTEFTEHQTYKTNYIYFGFRTNLRNLYDDF